MGEGPEQFTFCFKIPIMCSTSPCVLPHPLDGVEFRRIGREVEDLQPMPVRFEPRPDALVFVVGRIVLNQASSFSAKLSRYFFQKPTIGVRVEDRSSLVEKTRRIDFNGPEDLDTLSLSGHWDLRLGSFPGPGGVKGRILPETGLVREEECPSPRVGFFFMLGEVHRRQRFCSTTFARAKRRRGRWREKPMVASNFRIWPG